MNLPPPLDRPRVLIVSYGCDPVTTMETRLGWQRALAATRHCNVDVICHEQNRAAVEEHFRKEGAISGLTIHFLDSTPREAWLCAKLGLFSLGYRRWHQRAYECARRLHEARPFDVTHQVGYCGYREPGELWRIDAPFVWGPLGGTQNLPWRFLGLMDPYGALREVGRNLLNACHLRFRRRVAAASRSAAKIFAANSTVQRDLKKFLGVGAEIQLETGLVEIPPPTMRSRANDRPLRILWSGRFRPWKALPLLLHALQGLDRDIAFEVRILGFESGEARYRDLAVRLGVERHIRWVGWPPYAESLQHYAWADVFAFTSLRDTSGTGLLEALSHGCPIVGVDHQGAADIMTPACAVPIPVHSSKQAIRDFRAALSDLAKDDGKLRMLRQGAIERAEHFLWSNHAKRMTRVYFAAMGRPCPDDEPQPDVRSIEAACGESSDELLSAGR